MLLLILLALFAASKRRNFGSEHASFEKRKKEKKNPKKPLDALNLLFDDPVRFA
jgi:hypothetical protein